jgi:hypothetical protein
VRQERPYRPELARAAAILVRDQTAISAGETVLISTDSGTDVNAVAALMDAVVVAGAKPLVTVFPQLPFQGLLADPFVPDSFVRATESCDVWLDLTWPYLAGSSVHAGAMKQGKARYALLGDLGADGIVRLYGNVDLDRLYELQSGIDALMAAAVGKSCRVTTRGGTDVRFVLAAGKGAKARQANRPGSQTVLGSAVFYPEKESVRGTIVAESVFHEHYTKLPAPMVFEVQGTIKTMSGGGPELTVMDRALRRAGGGKYGHVIHFSYGFHPAARFGAGSFIEGIRAIGCNAVGFGVPWWEPGGGENHPDAVMTAQSLWIEDAEVVRDGVVIAPEPLAAIGQRLQPLYR